MNLLETLVGALMDLADDHEFGAVGTMRQDHLCAARTALAEAKRWEAVEGASENGDFLEGRNCVIPGVLPALLLIQKESSHD